MEQRKLIEFMNIIEKLKCNTRHSWTSTGRQESVAEHSWRTAVMALLCADEYPELDINKVVKMILLHDIGEAVTGDIPSFYKTDDDEAAENDAIEYLLSLLPDSYSKEFSELFAEMNALETSEARLYKALDNMEGLISHNEAPISSWLPLEYTENLVYGQKNVEWSEWTRELKNEIKRDAVRKMLKAHIRAPYQVLAIPFKVVDGVAKFAVFKRSDSDVWQFIAGGGTEGEEPFDAVTREVAEESGLDVIRWIALSSIGQIPVEAINESCRVHWDKSLVHIPEYAYAFETEGEATLSSEHTEYKWLEYDEALERLTFESNKAAVRELFYKPQPL